MPTNSTVEENDSNLIIERRRPTNSLYLCHCLTKNSEQQRYNTVFDDNDRAQDKVKQEEANRLSNRFYNDLDSIEDLSSASLLELFRAADYDRKCVEVFSNQLSDPYDYQHDD